MRKISVLDSSLRDGAQGIGISFSVEDKLNIVKLLDHLGVDYIEAGNPFSNPKELDFFQRAAGLRLKKAKIAAFGSTRRKNTAVQDDRNLAALLKAGTEVCTIFGKSWKLHVDRVLETTYEENLRMIEESCRFLKQHGKTVIYDAEHFFCGWKDDAAYATETLYAAQRGGADIICLCDTNGGTFPNEAVEMIHRVCGELDVQVGGHFHDDCGVAVANSVEGVLAGISHVQGTFLGFGERCGNANLSAVIPNLQLKMGCQCIPEERMPQLTQIAKEIAAIANINVFPRSPYIGKNAFAHKAGMHADGMLKTPLSFEHIAPETVGNTRRFPTSEISGRAVILEKMKMIFPDVSVESDEAKKVLNEVKELEQNGYQFEGADASFELLVRKTVKPFKPFFELLYYNIYTNYVEGGFSGASAVVKVKVDDRIQLMAAEGNGPVNALDTALRKALEVFYPKLSQVKLTDYKVRVLDSGNATASGVRVLITSSDGRISYTTVGVSEDVVAASWIALEDSIGYILLKNNETE